MENGQGVCGATASAEEIPSSRSLAHSVLKGLFQPLCEAVTRSESTFVSLYSKGILDEDTFEAVTSQHLTCTAKGIKIVRAVQKAVRIKVDAFEQFCAILDEDPIAKELVQELRGRPKLDPTDNNLSL